MAWLYQISQTGYPYASDDQVKQNNALEFWSFVQYEMTLEACCGILGNMERESFINPGQKQVPGGQGWGLIQWTPYTVLTNYASRMGGDWYDGGTQVMLILDEGHGRNGQGGRWIPTKAYPYSWNEFCQLKDVAEATRAYLAERERAGVSALSDRLAYATKWYAYLSGSPIPPTPGPGGSSWRHGAARELYRRRLILR